MGGDIGEIKLGSERELYKYILFCFVFVFMISLKPRPFVQSSFGMQAPDSHYVFLLLFGDVAFSEYFLYHFHFLYVVVCLKKNLNAPRPSEHPPVRGKNVKTFRWDQ